jgi:hypothetical protein
MTRWLADRRRVQPSTRALYDDVIRLHILPRIGRIYASAMTRDSIEELLEEGRFSRRNAQLVHLAHNGARPNFAPQIEKTPIA